MKREPSGGVTVAVAGLVATAAVGIIGTGAAWLSAREDRASARELARETHVAQRQLAQDARLFERRVDAYVEALRLAERQLTENLRAAREGRGTAPRNLLKGTEGLELTLSAFGSPLVAGTFGGIKRVTEEQLASGQWDREGLNELGSLVNGLRHQVRLDLGVESEHE